MDEIIEQLVEFAELDKDNMGLITYELMSLYESRLSLPLWFVDDLERMLIIQLNYYETHYKIVEREKTRTYLKKELEVL